MGGRWGGGGVGSCNLQRENIHVRGGAGEREVDVASRNASGRRILRRLRRRHRFRIKEKSAQAERLEHNEYAH